MLAGGYSIARSGRSSGIEKTLPPSEARNGADCVFIEIEDPEEGIEKIKGVVAKSLPRMGFAPDAITVLTPMQRGSLGGKNLNEILQDDKL